MAFDPNSHQRLDSVHFGASRLDCEHLDETRKPDGNDSKRSVVRHDGTHCTNVALDLLSTDQFGADSGALRLA